MLLERASGEVRVSGLRREVGTNGYVGLSIGQVESILNPCHHLLLLLVIDFLCMCFCGQFPTCQKVSNEPPLVVDVIVAST